MPVKPDSRFAQLPLLHTVAPDGSPRTVVALRLTRPVLPVPVRHLVIRGEAVDLLARRYFNDERLWWRILDANPSFYPLEPEPGAVLDVPAPGTATRAVRTRTF